uniref:Amine oxidase domain-containing protein n=2 Tax=Onchocerca TaxID=6281 RepID=A0A8R1Y1Y4_ONCVO
MRIVVIGAAPTGLGVAYRFYQLQNDNVDVTKNVELIILEKETLPGGLSRTVMDENGFSWDMGGHITFDHNLPYYIEAIRWAVDEWNILTRNCQVDISYMFNEKDLHLVPYPVQYAIPMFPSNIKKKCLKDLRDRCGKSEKINPPKNFDEWIKENFGPTLNNYFFKQYTQKVWTVKANQMNAAWVGSRVAKMPYKKLAELCAMNEKDLKKADLGWGPNARFMFPKHYGTGSIWKSMTDKLPSEWFRFGCESKIIEKAIECLIRKSIISREQIVSLFSILLPYGYPIPTINRDRELTRAHRILEKHEIYSRGRFGGWKYEVSNQDHCFIQGKQIIDRLLLGEPETIYKNGL